MWQRPVQWPSGNCGPDRKEHSMEKKTLAIRCISLLSAAFFVVFGSNIGESRFCLGDRIFAMLGIPAWSKGTQGLHYPGVIGILAAALLFYVFASTTRNKSKTIANLILGGSSDNLFSQCLDMKNPAVRRDFVMRIKAFFADRPCRSAECHIQILDGRNCL